MENSTKQSNFFPQSREFENKERKLNLNSAYYEEANTNKLSILRARCFTI